MAAHTADRTKLHVLQLRTCVWEKQDSLNHMDGEILELEKVTSEIEQADEIKENIYAILVRLDNILSHLCQPYLPQLFMLPV